MPKAHGLSISLLGLVVKYEAKNVPGAKCAECKKTEEGRVYKIVRISDVFSQDPAICISIGNLEKKTQKLLRAPVGKTLCADCAEKLLSEE